MYGQNCQFLNFRKSVAVSSYDQRLTAEGQSQKPRYYFNRFC